MPTNNSQNPYRGRVQDLRYRENASDGNHKHKHKSWLLPDQATRHLYTLPAHMIYCSRTSLIYHVWLLSSIVSKTKDQLTDSQIYGPIQFNCTRVHELDDSLIAWNVHKRTDVHSWWCHMNKSAIGSIATVLHELGTQLTSLITRECAHLIDT
jgi:hypothetical protein